MLGVSDQIKQKTRTAKISNVLFRKSRKSGKEEAHSFTSSITLRKRAKGYSMCFYFNHKLMEHVGTEQRCCPHVMASIRGWRATSCMD